MSATVSAAVFHDWSAPSPSPVTTRLTADFLDVRRRDGSAAVTFYLDDPAEGVHVRFPDISFDIFGPLHMGQRYATVHIDLDDKIYTQHWEVENAEQFIEFCLLAL